MGQDDTNEDADAEAKRQAARKKNEALREWKREREARRVRSAMAVSGDTGAKRSEVAGASVGSGSGLSAVVERGVSPQGGWTGWGQECTGDLQDAGSDVLEAAPAGGGQMDVFEEADVCKDLEVVQVHRRTVVKTGRLEHGSFALLSRAYSSGVSEWRFRLERLSGIVFLGVLEDPHSPRDGLARKLVSRAWMTSSYGYVCTTGGIRGQVARTDAAKKEAGALSPGALKFGAGDVVTVRMDRETRTVSFQVLP